MINEWLPVVGWEGFYEVHRDGEVRSVTRLIRRRNGTTQTFAGRSLRIFAKSTGYSVVRLRDESHGRGEVASVHRLVALAFVANPQNKPEINHIDGNKRNAHADNLEWVTPKENREHAWRTGLRDRSDLPVHCLEKNHSSKLTVEGVRRMRELRADGRSYRALGREFGVHHTTAREAVLGIHWASLPTLPAPPEASR